MKKLYKDQYGRIWIRIDFDRVWNNEAGYGGWFNGEGLHEEIYNLKYQGCQTVRR